MEEIQAKVEWNRLTYLDHSSFPVDTDTAVARLMAAYFYTPNITDPLRRRQAFIQVILLMLHIVSKQTWCLTSTETIRLIGDGEKGRKEIWRWGKREIIYLSLYCRHQNDSCIQMGSNESHFNVLLIVRDKVTRQCPQTTTFEEKGEPKRIRTEVPLLTSLTPYR